MTGTLEHVFSSLYLVLYSQLLAEYMVVCKCSLVFIVE
jgi:hypothetical protein